MILQPDEPARRDGAACDPTADGAGVADPATGSTAAPGPARPVHPTEMAGEELWVLPSIVLAFVALSGSVLLFAVVVVVGTALWLLSTPPLEPPEEGRDPFGFRPGGPFGGPGLMR